LNGTSNSANEIKILRFPATEPVKVASPKCWLWIAFAHQIYAVPDATVPALPIVYVGLGALALALANLIAAPPGAIASRTPAALVLRSE
jgi:hypothetical protein